MTRASPALSSGEKPPAFGAECFLLPAWRRCWRLTSLALALPAVIGAQTAETKNRDLDQTLVVATSETFYPYHFRDSDGQLKGFAVDVTAAVARAVNLRIRMQPVGNFEMADALRAGRVDLLQFFSETPERRVFFDFSVPIARFETVVVVRKNDRRIRTLKDLGGRRVGVGQKGNVGWSYLMAEQPQATPVFTESSEEFLRMISAGVLDAAVMSRLTAVSMIDRFGLGNLTILDDRIKGDKYDVRYCFTVRKGDSQLLARLNEGLAIVHRSGEFDTIYRKWFGRYETRTFRPVEVVSYVAAALALACVAVTWGFLRQRTLRRRIARQAAELAEQRSLLAALHEKHPLATIILEIPVEGPALLVSANPEAQRLFALESLLLPLPLAAVTLSSERRAYLEVAVKHWRDGSQTRQWETRLPSTQQWLETALVPLGHDEIGRQRLCVLSNDVTRRRLMDQEVAQSRRLRALGELVGGIAHEFNNLLTPIILTTSHARVDRSLRPAVQSDFAVIEGAARRAAELTQRLLTFGRKSDDAVKPMRLIDAVENCFALLRPTVDRRVEWTAHSAGELPPLQFNPTDLNQIVFNLVINARDTLLDKLARPHDGNWTPRLLVSLEEMPATVVPPSADADPTRVLLAWQRLTVEDNGLGIAPEIVDRLFEPFFTTKEVGRGTGLGLATVWHLVTEAGGEVTVDSTPGSGTQFHVTLPRWNQTAPAPGGTGAGSRPPMPGGGCRVLLVEDEPLVAAVATALLNRHGHFVTHRADGAEAWAHLSTDSDAYDLLLVDVNMPRMNGIDLIRHVRQTTFNGAIVVMSGRLTDQERRGLEELRVDRIISKPFSVSELTDALHQAQNRARTVVA